MLSLLRLLLPRACPGCGGQLGPHSGLCAACSQNLRARVEWHSPLCAQPAPHLVSLGPYRGVVRRSICALKYSGARELARPLGQALAAGVPSDWRIAGVIPVPLHSRRERERGYNQAALLAQVVADCCGVPCCPAGLRRHRATAQQAKQQVAERAANLQGAFGIGQALPGGTLLLLDDVLTTGETLLACRDALHAAGYTDLKYAVLAR
ncbi:ComF family protein [Deinococcus sp.]|uniref:ComF family protein n=1 Tax=Deinococcus sp. TaxID=47478 RepID=UPI0025BC09D2|nr:double zinc ribbon domain-containing protein [Deinococcus sp.]